MNKIYPLILALLVSAAAIAAERPRNGVLSISSNDNTTIRISVDGRNYAEEDNAITLSNVSAGYHDLQIYRTNKNRNPFGIFGGRGRDQLIYDNSVYIRPNYQMDIVINRNGRSWMNETSLSGNRDGRWNGNNNNNNGRWGNDNRNGCRRDNDGDDDDDDHNYGRNRHDNDDYNDRYRNDDRSYRNYGYDHAVSYQQFVGIRETLRRESFENNRLAIAKQMFDRNMFTADQVQELLRLFTFENNKLGLAKYAYRNTVDKNNYSVVYDVFSFSNSKQELANYISNYK